MRELIPFFDRPPIIQLGGIRAIFDRFPVSPGHMLLVPETPEFRLSHAVAVFDLIDILMRGNSCPGWNIGINLGECAGQTIPWHHIHIIPRFSGDVEDPRGGIRGVIPNRRVYPHGIP